MQAFVKYGDRPGEAELREAPVPTPGSGEVLLAVRGAGICGSDLHAYHAAPGYAWVRPPVILGHEFAGTVVTAGPGAKRFRPGDRVAVIGIQGCGRCGVCRSGRTHLCEERRVIGLDLNGGLAEFAVVGENHLVAVPDGIDLPLAALTEPLSVAAHGLDKIDLRPGQTVVVSGPGPIGLFSAVIARLGGARVAVVGIDADLRARLPAARNLGFTVINSERDRLDEALVSAFGGRPVDVWVEASGAPAAFTTAVGRVRRGGKLLIVGMYAREVNWMPTLSVRAEHSLFFSYASADPDYRLALEIMVGGTVDLAGLVRFYPLARAAEAFQAAETGAVVKAILVPQPKP